MLTDGQISRLFGCGLIPVIKLSDPGDSGWLCDALLAGGVDVAEITFRTDAAAAAIDYVSKNKPGIFVGAGTVTGVETVKAAVGAGAKFVVCPGFNDKVAEYCVTNGIPVIPGVSSPSDIERALGFGLTVLKFFPAEACGGLAALKAISAVYPNVRFIPTGGIDESNIGEYLAFDRVLACGGSWIVNEGAIRAKSAEEVTRLTRRAVKALHGFRFVRMSVPPGNGVPAIMDDIFNSESASGGEVVLRVNSVPRAASLLAREGYDLEADAPVLVLKNGLRIRIIGTGG